MRNRFCRICKDNNLYLLREKELLLGNVGKYNIILRISKIWIKKSGGEMHYFKLIFQQ